MVCLVGFCVGCIVSLDYFVASVMTVFWCRLGRMYCLDCLLEGCFLGRVL